ncbi:TPA: restriction endonuclease subunit S [Escherichia coli]|uniref:Restriction endonuclease subunit S n=1 Tax=Escherichia coli TaxID=562 RepID=A0A8B3M603_ECOLX|nr:restriction endonuclease subunit S [Escherichia coli]HBP1287818.1 restriction endonuclease subunit S [Escherichia coli str. K-12 substr. MG1655star]EEW9260655.1 restriction endonuclease subunit S [Escherichia coli]EFD1648094.1 restriction endonuclease subunit S [Escherichia coli]EFK3614426.1 restriction endonuclease subunit S [Escherichia coli]EFO4695980.1 restriction endonuclease subunit S [Escherichia coli]
MVPKGWSEHTLDDLALVERGKFSVRPRNDPRYYGGDMPFVQTGDVTSSGTYLKSFSQTLNENGIGVSKVFPKNTILITIAANIGDTAITTFEVACPDSVVAIQPYKHVADVYWLKKYLETRKTDLDAQSTQNAQKNINLQVLKPLLILTPPYAEQKKIAQILLAWDKAISVTEKLLANSQQQKKALMQQLLTGKKRLLDENGERFSGEWRNSTLSMFCNIAKGKALSASDLEVGDFPVIAGGKSSPYSHSDYTHENVVTVSASGAYAGYISYHNYKIWASDCSVVSAKADNLIDYFYQLLLSLQDKIYSLQSGGAQPHIYPKDLNSIPLWVPCVKEQQKIATVLFAADAEISMLEKKLACLKDEKKALMQQLLTGKRRVKVDEAVAE